MPKRMVWKPFLRVRENGSSYLVDPPRFLHAQKPAESLLKEITSMPKQKPLTLQQAFSLWSTWMWERAEEDGGADEIVEMMNVHGGFPRALSVWGYHIEIKAEDFELVG